MAICKECAKSKTYEWRVKNRDKVNAYHMQRYHKSERHIAAKAEREWRNSDLYKLMAERAKKKAIAKAQQKSEKSETTKAYRAKYKSLPHVKDRRKQLQQRPEKKASRAEYVRKTRQSCVKKQIDNRMSCRLRSSIGKVKASRKWESIVGYTKEDLMQHIESLFSDGMNWENIGQWHIDHIRPLCSFTYESDADPEFKEAWALQNLRPLWAAENLRKANDDRKHSRQAKRSA
jgi:hypothetical protein